MPSCWTSALRIGCLAIDRTYDCAGIVEFLDSLLDLTGEISVYAQIYAESSSTLTKGKTMRVWSSVDGLGIEVAEVEGAQVLRIRATCWDRENSGERGGEYNPVTRDFFLNLEKDEVEKLVLQALAEKLFNAMSIPSLARLEKIDQLENEFEQLRVQLKDANSRIEQLKSKIARAKKALK